MYHDFALRGISCKQCGTARKLVYRPACCIGLRIYSILLTNERDTACNPLWGEHLPYISSKLNLSASQQFDLIELILCNKDVFRRKL